MESIKNVACNACYISPNVLSTPPIQLKILDSHGYCSSRSLVADFTMYVASSAVCLS